MDRIVQEKLSIALVFPKLSSQNMGGFGHATILIPSFHGLPLGTPRTMASLLCPKYEAKRLANYESRCLRKRD